MGAQINNQDNENLQNNNEDLQNENQKSPVDDDSVISNDTIESNKEEPKKVAQVAQNDESNIPENGDSISDTPIPGENKDTPTVIQDANEKDDEKDMDKPDFLLRYLYSSLQGIDFADMAKISKGDVLHSLDTYKKSKRLQEEAAQLGLSVDDIYNQAVDARKKIQTLDYTIENAKLQSAIFLPGMDALGFDLIKKGTAHREAMYNETIIPQVLTIKGAAQAFGAKNPETGYFEKSMAMKGAWDVATSSKMERVARTIAEDGTLQLNTTDNGFYYVEDIDSSEELRTDDQLTTVFNSGIFRHSFMDGNKIDESAFNVFVRNAPFLFKYVAAVKFAADAITGLLEINKSIGDLVGSTDHSVANSVQNYLARYRYDQSDYAKQHPFSLNSIISEGVNYVTPLMGMNVLSGGLIKGANLLGKFNPEKVGKVANLISGYVMSATFSESFAKDAKQKGIPVKDAAWMHLLLTGLMGQASKVTQVIFDPLKTARRSRMIQQSIVDKLATFTAETYPKAGSEAATNTVKDIWNRFTAKMRAREILEATGKVTKKLPGKVSDMFSKQGKAMDKYFESITPGGTKWSALEFAEGFNTGGADMMMFGMLEEGMRQGYNFLHKDRPADQGRFADFDMKEFMRSQAMAYLYGGIGGGIVHTSLGRKFLQMPETKEYREGMTAYSMTGMGRQIMEKGLEHADYGSKELSVKKGENGSYLKVDPEANDPLQKISQYDYNKNLINSFWEMTKDRVDQKLGSLTPEEFKTWQEASQEQFGDLLKADLTSIKEDLNNKFQETESITKEIDELNKKIESVPETQKKEINDLINKKKIQLENKDKEIKHILKGGAAGYYTQKFIYENSDGIDKDVFPTFESFHEELKKVFLVRDNMEKEHNKSVETAKNTEQKINGAKNLKEVVKIVNESSVINPETQKHLEKLFDEQQEKYKPLFEELYKAYSDELDNMGVSSEDKASNLQNIKNLYYKYGDSFSRILGYEQAFLEDGVVQESPVEFETFIPKELNDRVKQAEKEYVGKDELKFNGSVVKKLSNISALFTVPETNLSLFMTHEFSNFRNSEKVKLNKLLDKIINGTFNNETDNEKPEQFDGIRFTVTSEALNQEPTEHLKLLSDRLKKRIALFENLNKMAGYSYLFDLDSRGGLGIEKFIPDTYLEKLKSVRAVMDQQPDMSNKAMIVNQFMQQIDISNEEFVESLKNDVKYLDEAYSEYLNTKRTPIAELNTNTAKSIVKEKTIISDVYAPLLDTIETIPEIKTLVNEIQQIASGIKPIDSESTIQVDDLVKMDSDLVKMKVKIKQAFDLIAEHDQLADSFSDILLKTLRDKKRAGNLNFLQFNILASAERFSTDAFYKQLSHALKESNKPSAPTSEQTRAIHELLGFVLNNIRLAQPEAKMGIMDRVFDKYQKIKYDDSPVKKIGSADDMSRYSHEKYENMMFLHAAWGAGKTKFIAGNFLKIFQDIAKLKNIPFKILATSGSQKQRDLLVDALNENQIEMSHKKEPITYKELIKMLKEGDSSLDEVGLIAYDEATFIPGGYSKQDGLLSLNRALKEYNGGRDEPLQLITLGDENQLGYMGKNASGHYEEFNIGQALTMPKTTYIKSSMRTSVNSIYDFLNYLKENYRDASKGGKNIPYQTSYGMTPNNEYAGVRVVDFKEKDLAIKEMVQNMNEEKVTKLIYITDLVGDDVVKIKKDFSDKYPNLDVDVINVNDIQGNEGKYILVDFRKMDYKKNDPIYEEYVMRANAVSVSRSEQFALVLNSSNRLWSSRKGSQTVSESELRESDFEMMKENTLKILNNSISDSHIEKLKKDSFKSDWEIPVTIETPENSWGNESISFDEMVDNIFNYEKKYGSLKGLSDEQAESFHEKLKNNMLMIYQHLANKANMNEDISTDFLAQYIKDNKIILNKEGNNELTDDYYKTLADIMINGKRKIEKVRIAVRPINHVKFSKQLDRLSWIFKYKYDIYRFRNKEEAISFEYDARNLLNSINIKLNNNTIPTNIDGIINELKKNTTLVEPEMKEDAEFLKKLAQAILYGETIYKSDTAESMIIEVFRQKEEKEKNNPGKKITLDNAIDGLSRYYLELEKEGHKWAKDEFTRAVDLLREAWDKKTPVVKNAPTENQHPVKDDKPVDKKDNNKPENNQPGEDVFDPNNGYDIIVQRIMNGDFSADHQAPKTKAEARKQARDFYNTYHKKGYKWAKTEHEAALKRIDEIWKNKSQDPKVNPHESETNEVKDDKTDPPKKSDNTIHHAPGYVVENILNGKLTSDGKAPKTQDEAFKLLAEFYGARHNEGHKWAKDDFDVAAKKLKEAWNDKAEKPKNSPTKSGPKKETPKKDSQMEMDFESEENEPVKWTDDGAIAYSWVKKSFNGLDRDGIQKIKNDILFGDGLKEGRYILKIKLRNAQETKDMDVDLSTHSLEDIFIEATDKKTGDRIVLVKFPYQGKSGKNQHNISAIKNFIVKFRPILEGDGIDITDSFINSRPKNNPPHITTVPIGTPGSAILTLDMIRKSALKTGISISENVYIMKADQEAPKNFSVVYYSENKEQLNRFEDALAKKEDVDITRYPDVQVLYLYTNTQKPRDVFNLIKNIKFDSDKISSLDISTIINGKGSNVKSPRGRLVNILSDIQSNYPKDKALDNLIKLLRSDNKSKDLLYKIKENYEALSPEVKEKIANNNDKIFTSTFINSSNKESKRPRAFNSKILPLDQILFVNSRQKGISSGTFVFSKAFWESIENNNIKKVDKISKTTSEVKNESGNSNNKFEFSDTFTDFLKGLKNVGGKTKLDFAADAFKKMKTEMDKKNIPENIQNKFSELAEKFAIKDSDENLNKLIDFALDEMPQIKIDDFTKDLSAICN